MPARPAETMHVFILLAVCCMHETRTANLRARAESGNCLPDNIGCQGNVSTHCCTDSPACLLKQLIVLC